MTRDAMLARLVAHSHPWDMIIIGGGATGVGIAVDAATRGYDVLLLEQSDFGKGTSSRSTKLIHGGVRYLEQGNIALVMEALKERGLLRQNAPHLVSDLGFIVPAYAWWESPFYGLGLKVYNLLAGKHGFGRSRRLSRKETLERLPTIRREGLRGGVLYYDAQFDDARLLIHLTMTAAVYGATLLNYAQVIGLLRDDAGFIRGVRVQDVESGREHEAFARVVINATGPFCDGVRRLADPHAAAMITPSQGIHLVFDRSFLPGLYAIMAPHTRDGRVMFAIPWHGHTLVGTTDTPIGEVELEPRPQQQEIDFILETAGQYLQRKPTRADIRSIFVGIRPLVRGTGFQPVWGRMGTPPHKIRNTAALSRDHTIHIDRSGLITITGGKWTTYRNMAEDCVDQAARLAHLDGRPCVTRRLRVHGYHEAPEHLGDLAVYGSDAEAVRDLIRASPDLGERLHPELPYCGAEVIWAARHEMARTVEDVLARRTRALILNARAATAMAPRVAELLAGELERDSEWKDAQVEAFAHLAAGYLPISTAKGHDDPHP